MEADTHKNPHPDKISEKKCPHCGEWTNWRMQAEDVCGHCGQLLWNHIQEKEERADRILSAPTGLFPVNPNDGMLLKLGKRTVNMAHVAFTAVVGFIIWFITIVVA